MYLPHLIFELVGSHYSYVTYLEVLNYVPYVRYGDYMSSMAV
jgi:hypothetical protein